MLPSQLHLQLLGLFILAQARLSVSQFVFELEVDPRSVTANFNCADGLGDSVECTIYFSIFCLREGRDTKSTNDLGDCPLGSSGRLNVFDERLSSPQIRRITSQRPWPVTFQLYIKARDSDAGLIVDLINSDDDLDDIFIDQILEVSSNFTELEAYTGELNRVTVQMRFRVMCQQDYYGADCSIFCVAQNDDVNGYYTCNSDGSLRCLEGFTNPQNNCRDTINSCDSSPCANSGSCIPGMGPLGVDYTCQCAAGYAGPRCEATSSATGSEMSGKKNATSTLLAIIVPLSVMLLIITVVTMVIIVVIIKWRRAKGKETHSKVHQNMDSMSIKMTDNPVYGQLSAESNTASVICETSKHTSHGATEITCVQNLVYGVNSRVNVDSNTL